MNNKELTYEEALKSICDKCYVEMGKRQVACPFRSISNEYCEEYEIVKESIEKAKRYDLLSKEEE